MAADPQSDIRTRLIAGNVGSPALAATDVFHGVEVPSGAQDGAGSVPDRAVFVRDLAGAEPDRHHDGTSYQQALVLVTVRSAKDSYGAGKTLANAVHAALESETLSADYVEEGCEATAARFAYVGTDEMGRHRWACTFRCIYVG